MKTRTKIISILVLLLIVIAAAGIAGKQMIDQKVASSHRIVVTSNAISEIFAKLHIKVVGVPKTAAKLPSQDKHVTKIGSPMEPNVEKIASLNPTDVYAVSTLKDQYDESFKKSSINATYLKLDSVADLKTTLKDLGQKYDRTNEANAQINKLNRAISTVKKRIHGRKPKVLILMGLPGANYMILTNKSYLGNLVEIAGGENVYYSQSQIYLPADNESLASKNPDIILRLEHALPNVTLPQFKKEFKQNSFWHKMKAVKEGKVYDLQQPDFNASANIRAAIALKKISNYLYPAN